MVRFVGLAALALPVFGERVAVEGLEGLLVGHLSAADSAKANRGFHVLSMLKNNPEDVELQNEYRDIIGDVDWEESKVLLETGAKTKQEPVLLGQMSHSGTTMLLAELLKDAQTDARFPVGIGRLVTNRRDYVVEEEGGESKYIIDGVTLSLHSRMHVSVPGEGNPRFILRRAFNYLNAVAATVGQYVYRVIACDEQPLNNGACNEGEILYTITKDRFGRGVMWGRDEYRVYTGTGGCSRHGHGVVSCHQSDQVMYSLAAGLSSGTHDTNYYKGNIVEINANGRSGFISDEWGQRLAVGSAELEGMKVAHITKVAGPPRWLHWPIAAAAPLAPVLAQAAGGIYNLARALAWADAYQMKFEGGGGPVDDLLISLMAAAQDLTRDRMAGMQLEGAVQGSVAAHAALDVVNGVASAVDIASSAR